MNMGTQQEGEADPATAAVVIVVFKLMDGDRYRTLHKKMGNTLIFSKGERIKLCGASTE